MIEPEYSVEVSQPSDDEAERYTKHLRDALASLGVQITTARQRDPTEAEQRKSFVIMLGGASKSDVAGIVVAWLKRNSEVELRIGFGDEFLIQNYDNGNTDQLVKFFSHRENLLGNLEGHNPAGAAAEQRAEIIAGDEAWPSASGCLPGDSDKPDD